MRLPKTAVERQIEELRRKCLEAFRAHRPKDFSGKIILVNATDLDDFMKISNPCGTFGWGGICKGGVEVVSIACHHLDFFKEPNITVLAEHISRFLGDKSEPGGEKVIERDATGWVIAG